MYFPFKKFKKLKKENKRLKKNQTVIIGYSNQNKGLTLRQQDNILREMCNNDVCPAEILNIECPFERPWCIVVQGEWYEYLEKRNNNG